MFNKELLIDGLDEGEKLGADYVELRYQDKYLANFTYRDGDLDSTTGSRHGICVRVLIEGSWGLATTSSIEKEKMFKTIRSAVKMARSSSTHKEKKVKLAEVDIVEDEVISPRKKNLLDVPVDEKLQKIIEAAKIQQEFPLVKSMNITYNEVVDKRTIVTNEGTRVSWENMIPTLMAYAVAIEEGKMASGFASWSHTCGAEFFDLHPIDQVVRDAHDKATRLVKASMIPSGVANVLLDPQLVGVLAHEAIGHTAEADLVMMGSFTQGKLGQKVCDEGITLVDEPITKGSKWMGSGWLPYDDEGVRGTKVNLIKDGVMTGYLTNRAYATEFGLEATGNARAYTFSDEPIVRMRNTYIEPRDLSFEELCEAIGDGYMLRSLQNGQADSNSEFMFGAVEGYRIKNGHLTEELYQNPVLTGNAFDVLNNIIGIGKDFDVNLGMGFCGKEQPAKVDAGGPHLAMRAMLAGGGGN
ncbi:MAG: TldD/PmbA family protein [Candidatus Heimdallarchaeota archaeon]